MKKRQRQKVIKHWKKVYEKNQLSLRKKLKNDGYFLKSLISLLEKYYSPELGETAVFSLLDPSREMRFFPLQDKNEYLKEAKNNIKKFDEKMTTSLFEDTDELIRKFHFGQEWETCFIIFLTTGVLIPPHHNLDMRIFPSKIKQDFFDLTRKEKVCIILNHGTSLDDIKYAFDDVEKMQKEIRSDKFIRKNATKSSIRSFAEVIEIELAKRKIAKDKDLKEKLSEFEEILYKKEPSKKTIDKINEVRKIQNAGMYKNRKKPPFKFRRPITDKEYIQSTGVKDNKLIQRKVNKIRKDRERYGK